MANPHDIYRQNYHIYKADGSYRAAMASLKIVFDAFHIDSLVDFGCGPGTWLAAGQALGANVLTGLEGPWGRNWIKEEILASGSYQFIEHDLNNPVPPLQKHDLAISVEVAEHLEPASADGFVQSIVKTSDIVLFSAAVPLQGGNNHLNEQWPSYWAGKFRQHGYLPFDVIRPRIWSNREVPWWYRQNMILYVSKNKLNSSTCNLNGEPVSEDALLDLIHPALHLLQARQKNDDKLPSLRYRIDTALGIPKHILKGLGNRLQTLRTPSSLQQDGQANSGG